MGHGRVVDDIAGLLSPSLPGSLASVDAEVTLVQYGAWLVLAELGTRHGGELAEALATHPSTTTRTCDRLVKHGLVRLGYVDISPHILPCGSGGGLPKEFEDGGPSLR